MSDFIKAPDDWEQIIPEGDDRKRPKPGAYLCRIIDAHLQNNRLYLNLDIADGEHKGYFKEVYDGRIARGDDNVFWGLTFGVPVAFDDPKNGSFFKRLYKRFAFNLELSNINFQFNVNGGLQVDRLKGKLIGALIYHVEKQSKDRIYVNCRVDKCYSAKEVEDGRCPEGWIEGVDGTKRKPDEPPPDIAVEEEDVDIPF